MQAVLPLLEHGIQDAIRVIMLCSSGVATADASAASIVIACLTLIQELLQAVCAADTEAGPEAQAHVIAVSARQVSAAASRLLHGAEPQQTMRYADSQPWARSGAPGDDAQSPLQRSESISNALALQLLQLAAALITQVGRVH